MFNLLLVIHSLLLDHTPFLYLTQSFWRDEAFSVLTAELPLLEIIKQTTTDFNPPLYYFILHFWMKLFGQGEIAVRMLSFVFHLALVFLCYLFAKKLKFLRVFTFYFLFFIFFNPMLLYFAFEARMYSLLAILATASMYFFYTKNWVPYVLTSSLGLWTQPFMTLVLLSQFVYLLFTRSLTKKHLFCLLSVFLLFSPWLPVILFQFSRSGQMWIWPINWTTITTIIGNLFTGYEGTPWGLWNQMAILSLVILGLAALSRRLLFLFWLLVPVTLILAISYFKPIYVSRYIIFVTVAEIFLIVDGISKIKNKFLLTILAICFLLFTIVFNVWFPSRHKKLDIRLTLTEINSLAKPEDLVYSQTPLTFFETNYYFHDRSRVFLYNPSKTAVPFYAGANLITSSKMRYNFPSYPKKAFLIHDDGTYETISQR